ncbi:uncharacterized protein [Diabrotica undecimpunctata]|uniref:uncharacterized protein n=1 Tax=Diabrotica undecimpunctata TaxID=50387 RepID=UPI003B642684
MDQKKNHTGSTFYDHTSKYHEEFRLPDEATIYTAEMFAISEALKYILRTYRLKSVIFTDCRGVIERLKNISAAKNLSHLEVEILQTNHEILSSQWEVLIVWIKGHSGIQGNEIADKFAKFASELHRDSINQCIPYTDLNFTLKVQLRTKWQELYDSKQIGLK